MTNSTVMIADMGILVGIFLLGLLAKLFPRKTETRDQGSGIRRHVDPQR
jgi:hypothetical protein